MLISPARSDKALLKFPRSLSDVRSLSGVLRKYRDENLEVVVAGFCAIYILSVDDGAGEGRREGSNSRTLQTEGSRWRSIGKPVQLHG